MNTANFISAKDCDYGVKEFTLGSNGEFVSWEEMYKNKSMPMCWAGFYKPQWLEICNKHNLTWYNFDSAYFGNQKRKTIFRLTVNGFQNTNNILERPNDRLEDLELKLEHFVQGSDIVIVPPDRKKCHTLGLGTPESWVSCLVDKLKTLTDCQIKIRNRPEPRNERLVSNTFKDFIKDNTYCVIGHSSNALVEAAMCDIPTIALGDSATKSLYDYNLEDIENIKVADADKKQAWLRHLSYCQFTRPELLSGFAWDVIN